MKQSMDAHSYFSPKLEVRRTYHGCAVFARQPIAAGEVLSVWGGRVVTGAQFTVIMLKNPTRQAVQIDDDLFMISETPNEPADCFNHSCNPNAGMRGQVGLEAMRDIAPGEQVTFDYAMCDSAPYDEFDCQCGAPDCRGRVTGDDWQRPALWLRYDGYFSTYLQKRINRLRGKL